MTKTQKMVAKIHNEFNTASDKALEEAKSILANSENAKKEKMELLKELGFYNTKEYHEFVQVENKRLKAELTAEVLQYVRFTYPEYKFITRQDTEKICKKYNLVLGNVSQYKGFIPEKNLKQLKAFIDKESNGGLFYGKEYMWIAAPLKDMEQKGYKLEGVELKRDIPDPIILLNYNAKGVSLDCIITAWGDEASDPIVVNEKMN